MKITLVNGDITCIKADAIVNAANKSLLGGGGVDGVIHRKAGPGLLEECKKVRRNEFMDGLPIGKVAVTDAYDLPAKKVIHTVGPVYGKDDIELLKDCYMNSILKADQFGCKSIAFPAISTGAYGVPMEESANVVRDILDDLPELNHLEEIKFVFMNEEDLQKYDRLGKG